MLGEQRNLGRRTLLSQIRKVGPLPRIELSEQTGISRATVTTITAELLERGLIEEIPVEPKGKDLKRGRPKVDLKICGAAFNVAGIKLANRSISIVICDFEGETLSEYWSALDRTTYAPEDLLAMLMAELEQATARADMSLNDISAFGLGLAGMVDVVEGVVRWSPSITERNFKLRDVLSQRLGKPVFIDNDANLVAKAEQYIGMGKNVSDFLVVTIENGVGMGIVLNNELYRGTRGCGAEFGHTKVHLDGALCRCGQRGCLEAYVADYALLREMAVGTQLTGNRDTTADMAALIEAARAGDKTANSVLDRAARMFAIGLANLVNIFDPKLIILSGERMQLDFLFADEVLESIRDIVVQVDAAPPEIVVHKWGDLMWATGAAVYAIEGLGELTLQELAGHVA
ncbi:ROK family transcriptional regulator [Maritalea mediterranea]|uniref:ROK family protein n=1 Tax=Maritalea mediterranea TaxID=2909667 RepID=A0ABS9E6J0_9HYPH|nr:ROK family transcriptional regulator [Maritalea mediterranea]MCF4098485.1 ROK family protein [Maritalea mediterranea]